MQPKTTPKTIGYLFVIILVLVYVPEAYSQQYQLRIITDRSANSESLSKKIKVDNYNKLYTDSIKRFRAMQKILVSLYEIGYVEANFDSINYSSEHLATAYLHFGDPYNWKELVISDPYIQEAGLQQKRIKGRSLSPQVLSRQITKILNYAENNGYPFAMVQIDSIRFDERSVTGKLKMDRGDLIVIDSIVVKGNSKLSRAYLYNYLSIKPGDIYNEAVLQRISVRIREIPFIKEIKPFYVVFNERKARVVLFIDEQNSNSIDGIIGLLPDAKDKKKLNLTGEANISLRNSFHQGEVLDLRWKQQRPRTQDLKIKASYPFLFSTPFGAEARLNIYKQDTTFLDLGQKLGLQYFLRGGNYLQVYFEGRESNLLSTKDFENANSLPAFADVSTSSYGIGYASEKLDYRFNPRKGYSIELTGSVGKKKINKNTKVNEELYDSLDLSSTQYKVELTFDYYVPLGKLHVLDFGVIAALLEAENIFDNELYRFGGLKTLRGFDEEILRASKFTIWKIEYRYLLEQNSFLFLFVNG
ncbi:MAG: BamA/TamA family outer membrane protein, partial [Bacteroidia bacterium]|nr:BamA/TamA family outer membrane protein [Bacteroidia bacterium]